MINTKPEAVNIHAVSAVSMGCATSGGAVEGEKNNVAATNKRSNKKGSSASLRFIGIQKLVLGFVWQHRQWLIR
jgi:hypothetical protein